MTKRMQKRDLKKCYRYIKLDNDKKLSKKLETITSYKQLQYAKLYLKGRTLIHHACKYGSQRCLQKLNNRCFHSNNLKVYMTYDKNGWLPIHTASLYVSRQDTRKAQRKAWTSVLRPVAKQTAHAGFTGWLSLKMRGKLTTVADILGEFLRLHPHLIHENEYATSFKLDLTSNSSSSSSESESSNTDDNNDEVRWRRKLASEFSADVADEDNTFHLHGYESGEDTRETYDEWANRLAKERHYKHYTTPRRYSRPSKKKSPPPTGRESSQKPLQSEADLFAWSERRRRLLLVIGKRQYESKCEELFKLDVPSSSEMIDVNEDLPWLAHGFAEMLACDVPLTDRRRYLTKQQLLWHPDSFQRKCKKTLPADVKELDVLLDKVKSLSQSINQYVSNMGE